MTEPFRGRGNSRDAAWWVAYYKATIKDAAQRLRAENVGHMVATDLEDSLRWSHDPATCAHPFQDCRRDGSTVCRSCGADTSDMEGMGT
jgi:hypothetical protein